MTKILKKPTVAKFLAQKIAESGKTQREIATEIGYPHANIITMFKTASTKLPLTIVGPIARALQVDPAYLIRLVLAEYYPETLEAVEDCLGTTILTARERQLIDAIRRCSGHTDPPIQIAESDTIVGFIVG